MQGKRFICIHGHFYQPPRENPWLGKILPQDSARPYHDWNERISNECYRQNGLSRLIDEQGFITGEFNNYEKISFNFGPTLLAWMEEHDPVTYAKVLEGDQLSLKRYKGHGSAIAQVYNHIIMPLATRREKETQIIWGLKDFEYRFKRAPESMWLAETAVDLETLDILASNGMKYVILAPRQAQKVRKIGDENWNDVSGERVFTTKPYIINLPSGKSISAFFYNGNLAKSVAFEGLLHDGAKFAHHLANSYRDDIPGNQLIHIATDGESYGHHHRHGEMALTYALKFIEDQKLANLTNYGLYLSENKPVDEVQIYENSSWSCVHGIERWRSNCGCNSGGKPDWNQQWRAPLRNSLNNLREQLTQEVDKYLGKYNFSIETALHNYIELFLNSDPKNKNTFLSKWAPSINDEDEKVDFFKCFEIFRHINLMFTSCAWFFDEISGLETVQVLQYAQRAIDLAEGVFKKNFELEFVTELEKAKSNISMFQNGRGVIERCVRPAKVDFFRMAIHYSISSLFDSFENSGDMYSYSAKMLDFNKHILGKNKIVCAKAEIISQYTLRKRVVTFVAMHFGGNNINAGIRFYESEKDYLSISESIKSAVMMADLTSVIRIVDREFGPELYSLKDLFDDERSMIVDEILSETMSYVDGQLRSMYQSNYSLMFYLSAIDSNLPHALSLTSAHVVNQEIILELKKSLQDVSVENLAKLLEEAIRWSLPLEDKTIGDLFSGQLVFYFSNAIKSKKGLDQMVKILSLINIRHIFPFPIFMNDLQHKFYSWMKNREKLKMKTFNIVSKMAKELKVRMV